MWEIRAMKEKEREHQSQIKKDMEWAFAWACLKPPMSHLQQTHHLLQHANVNSNGYGYYSLCSVKGTILLLQRRFVSSRATILTLRHYCCSTTPWLYPFLFSLKNIDHFILKKKFLTLKSFLGKKCIFALISFQMCCSVRHQYNMKSCSVLENLNDMLYAKLYGFLVYCIRCMEKL